MGTRNYLGHFILSVFLCTAMALEGGDTTTTTAGSHANVLSSTNNTPGQDANGSSDSVADPNTQTAPSLLGPTSLSPSTMRMNATSATKERNPAGISAGSSTASPALPTMGTGTAAPSTGTERDTASSPPRLSATTSHSSSSSSSSSPKGSPAPTSSPRQSSTSRTTGMPLATTSHSSPALTSLSSSAAMTSAQPSAEAMEPGTATPRSVTSTLGPSPASGAIETRPSPALGSSTETSTAQLTSTPLTQGQPDVEVMATSSPVGSPSPSVATASVGSRATTPPREGESSTMGQGSGTTSDPSAETSHSIPATSLVSTTRMVSGEERTNSTPTPPALEGSLLGTSPVSGAVSPALPTTGPSTTTDPESGSASSLSFSSPTTSRSSSSPGGSSAVTPSPQQSSNTTAMLLATASHPPTAGVTGVESDTVTAEEVTPSPAPSTNPVASASITSRASDSAAPSRSPTPGSDTQLTTTALTQGQPAEEVTATSSPVGSPSPSTTSVGSRVTTPPGKGESSTMNQGIRTAEPTAKTSLSLPSTSLATPSTTNLRISTSVNPSSTGACLAVSVEVQNVTGEEIRLSWTSGSKDSLYNISVMEGQEIKATKTTNETKAVFANLLPGHLYTISVAVSSCAENARTSVIVRTDPASCFKATEFCSAQSTGCSDLKGIVCSDNLAFACRVREKNLTFHNTLYNSDSEDYVKMSESFKTDVVRAMRAELGNDRSDVLVLGFRPGSVITDFLFLLLKGEAVDVEDIKSRLSKVLEDKFGSPIEVRTLSVQSSSDNSSSWRVAVIVLGVLLGVALVLILLAILFFIYMRRRSGIYFG